MKLIQPLIIILIMLINYDLGLLGSIKAQEDVTSNLIENLLIEGMEKGIKGDYQGAIATFTDIIILYPQEPEAYYNRGIAYERLHQWEQAIADFNRTVLLNPEYAEAYAQRGQVYLILSQNDQAIADLDKARSLFQKQGNAISYQRVNKQLEKLLP